MFLGTFSSVLLPKGLALSSSLPPVSGDCADGDFADLAISCWLASTKGVLTVSHISSSIITTAEPSCILLYIFLRFAIWMRKILFLRFYTKHPCRWYCFGAGILRSGNNERREWLSTSANKRRLVRECRFPAVFLMVNITAAL